MLRENISSGTLFIADFTFMAMLVCVHVYYTVDQLQLVFECRRESGNFTVPAARVDMGLYYSPVFSDMLNDV